MIQKEGKFKFLPFHAKRNIIIYLSRCVIFKSNLRKYIHNVLIIIYEIRVYIYCNSYIQMQNAYHPGSTYINISY